MKLNTFTLTLCVCALYVRAASIPAEKKIDDLANVDLDDVAIEPELSDQATVKDVDNNLRKTIDDIPVKVVEEPSVIDENSNDYVPQNDDNIIVRRIEIDLANPGPPQRQEHETQNPENYGAVEKALFGIKESVINTQNVFNQGFQEVSNSFKTLFGVNENLPAIHQNLENLKHSFTDQIDRLNLTIISNLKSDQTNKLSEKKLKIAESHLENLKKNFNAGVDTLTEGVEVLTIIKEEDEAIKTKSIISEKGVGVKADTDTANAGSSEAPPTQTQAPVSSNPVITFLTNFQNGMTNAFSNFTNAIQNNFNPQPGSQGSNPIVNFFQGINLPNIIQGQNQAQQPQGNPPAEAQADAVAATSAPTPTAAPWGPQAFFQQVQNTWQNFVNPGQNVQHDTPQPQQPAQQPTNNGPIAQAFQNIVQFIQRPGQAFATQQPAKPPPAQGASSESSVASSNNPQNTVPQADVIPAVPAQAGAIPAAQTNEIPASPQQTQPAPQQAQPAPQQAQPVPQQAQPAPQQQAVQNGPIQQLVQNNPIIKGIQSAVQRIQGTPNPETPRNEIIKEEHKEGAELKGRPGRPPNANQGDNSVSGVEEEKYEQSEEVVVAKGDEEILEGQIKAEVAKLPSLTDKTE